MARMTYNHLQTRARDTLISGLSEYHKNWQIDIRGGKLLITTPTARKVTTLEKLYAAHKRWGTHNILSKIIRKSLKIYGIKISKTKLIIHTIYNNHRDCYVVYSDSFGCNICTKYYDKIDWINDGHGYRFVSINYQSGSTKNSVGEYVNLYEIKYYPALLLVLDPVLYIAKYNRLITKYVPYPQHSYRTIFNSVAERIQNKCHIFYIYMILKELYCNGWLVSDVLWVIFDCVLAVYKN